MSGNDLFEPLGYGSGAARKPARATPWKAIGLAGAGVAVAGLAALSWMKYDGMAGEPWAVAKIERPPAPPAPVVAAAPPVAPPTDVTGSVRPPVSSRATASEVELESGVRVVRRGEGETAPGALIIHVPDALGVQLTPAPDRRLVEKGRYGSLPKIGPDGSRAADVYARPIVTAANIRAGAPRIAIVVGGMGLSQQATQNAAGKLPGAVTLAFAPYGADVERQVARVRETGHEVVLQLPMEPWDAAQSPGPHTLRAGATSEQNIDDLHWLMSRFTGYVGVANFLGAKFLANEAALSPVLRETAARGLFFLDDATGAPGATSLAASVGASALRVDIVLDAAQKADAVDAELAKLEALARQKGAAIGFATGLPATVDSIARFARNLDKRGVALVPLSSLAASAPQPSAGVHR